MDAKLFNRLMKMKSGEKILLESTDKDFPSGEYMKVSVHPRATDVFGRRVGNDDLPALVHLTTGKLSTVGVDSGEIVSPNNTIFR